MAACSISPRRTPSLRGAKLRNQRAANHLWELERKITEFQGDEVRATVDKDALEAGEVTQPVIDWSSAKRPPTWWMAIVAGETLYNLRASLDYLVYALAVLDSGARQKNTQFPIAATSAAWSKQRAARLRGVNIHHRARLESYQPFRGCEWTRTLRDLSNPDKHQTLTSVHTRFDGLLRASTETAQPVSDEPNRLNIALPGQTMGFYFWNDHPVIETLTRLTRDVAEVLGAFQGDFGEFDEVEFRSQSA